MSTAKLTPREIVERLQMVEALVREDTPLSEALRWAGLTEAAYFRWRSEYDGLLRTLAPLRSVPETPPKRKRRPARARPRTGEVIF